MKSEDTPASITNDITVLREIATKILSNINKNAVGIDFSDPARKVSLIRELVILTDLILKLEQVQCGLDSRFIGMSSNTGITLTEAEVALARSYLSRVHQDN